MLLLCKTIIKHIYISFNIYQGGEFFEALKKNNPESETLSTEFSDMQHGWSLRGDVSDEKIKLKVELFLEKTFAYLAKYF